MLKQMLLCLQPDMLAMLVPLLLQWHSSFHQSTTHRKFAQHKAMYGELAQPIVDTRHLFARTGKMFLNSSGAQIQSRQPFSHHLHVIVSVTFKVNLNIIIIMSINIILLVLPTFVNLVTVDYVQPLLWCSSQSLL